MLSSGSHVKASRTEERLQGRARELLEFELGCSSLTALRMGRTAVPQLSVAGLSRHRCSLLYPLPPAHLLEPIAACSPHTALTAAAMARTACLLALALALLESSAHGARLLKGQALATSSASASGQGASWASASASTDSGKAVRVWAGRWSRGWVQRSSWGAPQQCRRPTCRRRRRDSNAAQCHPSPAPLQCPPTPRPLCWARQCP